MKASPDTLRKKQIPSSLADMDVDEIKGSIVMANCGTGKGGFKLGNSCAKGDKNLEKSTKTGENTNHERTGKQSKNGNSGRQAGERGENEIERAIREAIGTGSGGGRYQQIQEQRESLRKLGEETTPLSPHESLSGHLTQKANS